MVQGVMSANPGGEQQEVTYPAAFGSIGTTGPFTGARDVQRRAQAMAGRCPNTQLVLAGYSQGAMVMTQAISNPLPMPVAAVVLWGSPYHQRGRTEMDAGTGRATRGGIFAGRGRVPANMRAVTRDFCNGTPLLLCS